MAATSDIDFIIPVDDEVKLVSGRAVILEQLKSRQFFKLLRIITHGAGPMMMDHFQLDPDEGTDTFVTKLVSMMVLSIPDAENEAIAFIKSMVRPAGLIESRNLNRRDRERNTALTEALDEELENPELDDLVTIVEAVVRREAPQLQALGKRLSAMFKLAQQTGQLTSQNSQTATSSADSAAPVTSSARSTRGRTKTSSTSHLPESDSAPQPSPSDAGSET